VASYDLSAATLSLFFISVSGGSFSFFFPSNFAFYQFAWNVLSQPPNSIHMKAKPIQDYPAIYAMSQHVSQTLDSDFNIGVDVIVYRDATERIGWHADDSQGENRIFCLVVESSSIPEARPLKIRRNCGYSKKAKKGGQAEHLEEGDEEVELYPMSGDGYEMDGIVQQHYVHSLPAERATIQKQHGTDDSGGRRFALIFRQGAEKKVCQDSGTEIASISPVAKAPLVYTFGDMPSVLKQGESYFKSDLVKWGAHR
jgi:alkylated DNA repair dioxygenase AlkB